MGYDSRFEHSMLQKEFIPWRIIKGQNLGKTVKILHCPRVLRLMSCDLFKAEKAVNKGFWGLLQLAGRKPLGPQNHAHRDF